MSSNMVVMTFSNEHTAEQVRDRLVEQQKAHLCFLQEKSGPIFNRNLYQGVH